MANNSVTLTSLDFASNRAALKAFYEGQEQFKDYDFDSSNMSVLLDGLAYNTYLNAFYLNMVGNEMFLDSAQLRDSVVSHAKELNYLPRSFTSAVAKINLTITSSDPSKRSVVIPKGTAFLTRVGSQSYTFSTAENIVLTSSTNIFTGSNISIYEGVYQNETYQVDYSNTILKYKINNNTVDVSSISVTVIEDNGAVQVPYTRATSLFGYDASSKIFFVQPAAGDTYEVIFGDGIIGRKPKNKSVVLIEYRTSNGELPNGASSFTITGRIDDEALITISTSVVALGGAVAETLESIKFNAPRAFTTQERAVTAEDYENLLKINFPEINAVSAYGGEDVNPPQYGRVFISIDLVDVDGLPQIKQNEYYRFIRSRSSVAMEPIFVTPDYTYLYVNTKVKYNINTTVKNPEDIRTAIISAILDYSSNNLNNFNRTLRYSKLVKAIDDADTSIISNETDVELVKYITPLLNVSQDITVDFKTQLTSEVPLLGDEHPFIDIHGVSSSTFTYSGQSNCKLEDNGDGVLRIVTPVGNLHKKIIDVGTVDYDTGIIILNNFNISSYEGTSLKIYVIPRNKDIASSQNVILNIIESDIDTTIEQVRE